MQAQELVPAYWVQNLVSCVRFSNALTELLAEGDIDSLVGIDLHGAVAGSAKQILKATTVSKTQYFSALFRGKNAISTLLELATKLFSTGHTVDIGNINNSGDTTHHPSFACRPSLIPLEPYPKTLA